MLAPWADILYAMDAKWWKEYMPQIQKEFQGRLVSTAQIVGVNWLSGLKHYSNSGAGAISVARKCGAKRVYLLGYDSKKSHLVHWHGDHPKSLGNAGSMPKWPGLFAKLAQETKDTEIVNCSRQTVLTCFERKTLEECLC